mmetsp:Transcript_4597/g.16489  ORF Transcript_4597/g.16489 Transcript_4597/m.16489 type:complete len:224 (-) Transcript_4597:181-852(-)
MPYSSRQACAHCPLLADRPPQASDEKHWPLYETQRAPCTKTSSSGASSSSRLTLAISPKLSSRPRTTLSAPRDLACLAPGALHTLLWVEAWTLSPGATSRASRITPKSWTMTASTPALSSSRRQSATLSSSFSNTNTFTQANPLTPYAFRKSTTSPSSPYSKLLALALALKDPFTLLPSVTPKYTASAPLATAALSWSHPPTGARTSGFTRRRRSPSAPGCCC